MKWSEVKRGSWQSSLLLSSAAVVRVCVCEEEGNTAADSVACVIYVDYAHLSVFALLSLDSCGLFNRERACVWANILTYIGPKLSGCWALKALGSSEGLYTTGLDAKFWFPAFIDFFKVPYEKSAFTLVNILENNLQGRNVFGYWPGAICNGRWRKWNNDPSCCFPTHVRGEQNIGHI